MRVELTNFEVDLSRDTVEAGDVTLLVLHESDHGHSSPVGELHDLVVARDGEIVARSGMLHAGEEQSLDVALEAGTYDLYCSVVEEYDDEPVIHADEGMRATLTVVDGEQQARR